jgi:hypothetical protein
MPVPDEITRPASLQASSVIPVTDHAQALRRLAVLAAELGGERISREASELAERVSGSSSAANPRLSTHLWGRRSFRPGLFR